MKKIGIMIAIINLIFLMSSFFGIFSKILKLILVLILLGILLFRLKEKDLKNEELIYYSLLCFFIAIFTGFSYYDKGAILMFKEIIHLISVFLIPLIIFNINYLNNKYKINSNRIFTLVSFMDLIFLGVCLILKKTVDYSFLLILFPVLILNLINGEKKSIYVKVLYFVELVIFCSIFIIEKNYMIVLPLVISLYFIIMKIIKTKKIKSINLFYLCIVVVSIFLVGVVYEKNLDETKIIGDSEIHIAQNYQFPRKSYHDDKFIDKFCNSSLLDKVFGHGIYFKSGGVLTIIIL